MTDPLQVNTREGVCTLTLNRPDKRNALNEVLYARLTEALARAADEERVRVVRLTGAGPDFTAGSDLAEFRELARSGGELRGSALLEFLHAVVDFPKPLVAQVHGSAAGIGTTLMLHCDFSLAVETARFVTPFVALGVVPEFGSSRLLPALVGHSRAAEILLLGRALTAREAEALGLITRSCKPGSLDAESWTLCQRLSALPAGALAASRRLLRSDEFRRDLHRVIDQEAEVFAQQMQTPEHREAVEAFFARSD